MRNSRDMWNVPPMGESDPDETVCTSTLSTSESDSEADNITDNPNPKRAQTE